MDSRKILIGTSNPAKVADMAPLLALRGLEAVSGEGYAIDPEENGGSPAENAAIKARAYCAASGLPTLSFDSGLYILDLPMDDPRQPGLHIRRVGGKRLTDEEMLHYYSDLSHQLGGRVLCQFVTGFAAAVPDGRLVSGEDREGQPKAWQFYLVDKPLGRSPVGKPLHSISVEADSGLYFTQRDKDGSSVFRRRAIRERAIMEMTRLLNS